MMHDLSTRLKNQHQLVSALPVRLRLAYAAAGLLLTLVLFGIAIISGISRHQAWFQANALHIKSSVESRLQLSESILFSLTDDARQKQGFEQEDISTYARYMQTHYPFIHTMGFQPLIKAGERAGYEAAQSTLWQRPITIQGYTPEFATGRQAAQGKNGLAIPRYWQSIPLTMIEPRQNHPASPIGMDLLSTPVIKHTIVQAMRSGELEVSLPLTLSNGRPGLAYVQAIYEDSAKEVAPQDRKQYVRGITLLAINTDQLLQIPHTQGSHTAIRLHRIDSKHRGDDIASHQSMGDPATNTPYDWLLPKNHTRLRIDRNYFPYELEISETARLPPIPPAILILLPCASALLCYLLLLVAGIQRQAQSRHDEVSRSLDKEREQAMVTLQAINDAVIVIDQHRQIKYINPKACRLIEKKADDMRGQPLAQALTLHYELATEAAPDLIAQCIESRQDVNLPQHCHLIRHDSQHLYIEGTLSPLRGPQGEMQGVVIAIRDMAPLRARMAESILHREERLKQHAFELARVARITSMSEMASGIAHEINQPLSAIASYNEAALTLLDDDEPDRHLLKRALQGSVEQAQRAGHIVHGLRNLATRQRTERVPVDINQAIRNTLMLADSELNSKTIHLSTCLESNLPRVFADSIQLEQVLFNLIRNAVEAMPAQRHWGCLSIRSDTRDSYVRVHVHDSGHGIPVSDLPHIFDPFFSHKHQGMGLGLTISQSVIESFGGTIHADNHPDGGAVFRFELPAIAGSQP